MELDPHALYQIVQRIDQQMRCPQCGGRVPVDFASVQVMGDSFIILQLKCSACSAYIVLHATLAGLEHLRTQSDTTVIQSNASSQLHLSDQELGLLRQALQESGGSFADVFRKYGIKK